MIEYIANDNANQAGEAKPCTAVRLHSLDRDDEREERAISLSLVEPRVSIGDPLIETLAIMSDP